MGKTRNGPLERQTCVSRSSREGPRTAFIATADLLLATKRYQMSTLGMRTMSGVWCLLLMLVSLASLTRQIVGQSTPAQVVGPTSGDSKIASSDRTKFDRPRSIELYRTHCLECHEEDGRGKSSRELMRRIPDFTQTEWHRTHDDASLQKSIREGKGMMPPKKGKLSPTELVLLVTLIRDFQGGKQVIPDEPEGREVTSRRTEPRPSAEPAKPGVGATRPASRSTSEPKVPPSEVIRALFRRSCAKCHGADGQGNAVRVQFPRIPNFASSNWQKGRIDAQLTASILEGKGTAMPAFSGKLGEAQVRELVTYLRSFAPAESRSISGTSDFYRRYLELRKEMDDLERQYRAMSRP
jgi:mono/diheme cytochrome c family protein